jgi:hypothetical protein
MALGWGLVKKIESVNASETRRTRLLKCYVAVSRIEAFTGRGTPDTTDRQPLKGWADDSRSPVISIKIYLSKYHA